MKEGKKENISGLNYYFLKQEVKIVYKIVEEVYIQKYENKFQKKKIKQVCRNV